MNILSNQRDVNYLQRPVKLASIFLKGSIAYLASQSQTTFLQMATPPFIKTDWFAKSVSEKYELIMEVLNASQKDLIFPQDPKAYSEYILNQFGETSFRQMEKGGKCCNITLHENKNTIEFQSTKYKNNGFEGIGESIEVSTTAKPEVIVSALESALIFCE